VHEGDEITMKMGENCHRLFLSSFIDSVHFRLLARKMILIIAEPSENPIQTKLESPKNCFTKEA